MIYLLFCLTSSEDSLPADGGEQKQNAATPGGKRASGAKIDIL